MKRIETETNIAVRCTLNLFLIHLLQMLWCAAPLEAESINPWECPNRRLGFACLVLKEKKCLLTSSQKAYYVGINL
jgi:hypothetical protein